MTGSLPASFLLAVVLAMIGIPLYLLAYGGIAGSNLTGLMRGSDDLGAKDDDEDKDTGGKQKKRSNDDPGSPLDISDLGGLGALIGISALVVLGFTLFPQELNGIISTLSGSFDLTSFSPWQMAIPKVDRGFQRDFVAATGSTSRPPRQPTPPPEELPMIKMPSVDTVARHLRLLRAQPILLVGYNDDHMETLAVVLGILAVFPAAYIFGQLVWDAQDASVRQSRLDLSLKMQDTEMRQAETLKKRAELFEEDAKRIRRDQLNMLEDIKSLPPWWNVKKKGDFEVYKQRELARRREETNTLAERATQKAALFKKRQAALEEKWQPKETTKNGKVEKEDNLFPGIPLLSYMRKRSRGGETKASLNVKGLLGTFPDLTKMIMDTEDLTSRSRFNSEGKKKHPQDVLGVMGNNASLRKKMFDRWWKEDGDDYQRWKRNEDEEEKEDQLYDKEEQRMRAELVKKIREKLMRGERIQDPKGKKLQTPSRSEVRAAVTAQETASKASAAASAGAASGKSNSGGWKGFLKAIAP